MYVVISVAYKAKTNTTYIHCYGPYSNQTKARRELTKMQRQLNSTPDPDWLVSLYPRKIIDIDTMNLMRTAPTDKEIYLDGQKA